MKPDLGAIGLPLQIIGAALLLAGVIAHAASAGAAAWRLVEIGAPTHVIGDAFFFFQMKKQKCL
ncbi:MAG TPA: hypothetical protein VKQ28_16755 [Candidatus Acidoferrum sp.]|nr:hypothetical protein [Candidatus Acidoferrum sp.]